MLDKKIIDLIRNNQHSKALNKLYKIYPAILKYVTEYGGTESDAEDIFQDGLLVFMNKINDINFQLSSSISTYIFGICKNLNKENIRKTSRIINKEPQLQYDEYAKSVEEFLEEEQKYQVLDKVLIKGDKKCIKLLKMFYYEKLSMKVIASKLGFKSETSAKTQKYKCLEKIRSLASTVLSKIKTTVL